MIFNSNSTNLGTVDFPMLEGYDSSYGCALALVEGAQNDLSMFRAMLDIDATELKYRSNGYVNESSIVALQEATASGIWNKIVDFLKKLGAKIKTIFNNFIAKLRGVFMKDKALVKKYRKEVNKKISYMGKLEVKWRKLKSGVKVMENPGAINDVVTASTSIDAIVEMGKVAGLKSTANGGYHWDEDPEVRFRNFWKHDESDFAEDLEDLYWDDDEATTYELSDTGTNMTEIMNYLESYDKTISALDRANRVVTKNIERALKKAETNLNDFSKKDYKTMKNDDDWKGLYYKDNKDVYGRGAGKNLKGEDTKTGDPDTWRQGADTKPADDAEAQASYKLNIDNATRAYDMLMVIQSGVLIGINTGNKIRVEYHKQAKAAFMKAVTVSVDKLKESTYVDAVAEAAEDEVDQIFTNNIDKSGIADLSNASTDVLDPGSSNDPDELVYDYNRYVARDEYSRVSESYTLDLF